MGLAVPIVKKEIARVGSNCYIDPQTGLPRVIHFSPAGLKHLHDSGLDMLSAGLSVPVPLEHQPEAKPLTAAEKAAKQLLNNAGWVAGYELGKVKDESGQEIDALFGNLDIQDPEVAKKLPATIKWTSPWITSFVDGAGKERKGVIGHVALTTRPRITKQQPFQGVAAALSLVAATKPVEFTPDLLAQGQGMPLSRAGLLKGEGATLAAAYPMAFSLWSGIALAEGELPPKPGKEKTQPSKPPPKPDEKPEATPPSPTPAVGQDGMPLEKSLVDPDGDISVHDVLCDLLSAIGIEMPEGTDSNNFEERLYKAAMEGMKNKGQGATMADPPNQGNQPPGGMNKNNLPPNPIIQEQPPMYMSLEEVQKITDPVLKQVALSLYKSQEEMKKHQERTQALEKNAIEAAGRTRQGRIDRLARVLDKAQITQLTQMATGMAFSLGADGKVADPLSITLDLLEGAARKAQDIPALLKNPVASFDIQAQPTEYAGGAISEERANQVADEMLARLPGSLLAPKEGAA